MGSHEKSRPTTSKQRPITAASQNSASLSRSIQQTAFKSSGATVPSPPRTPPQQVRTTGPREYLTIRPVQPETFLDDITPTDGNARGFGGDYPEDPHDLSLSPRYVTRASVVDNMLLSLDQFSSFGFDERPPLVTEYYSPEPEPEQSFGYSTQTRSRGHTLSSSLSSDQDFHVDVHTSRYANHLSRGRRSNSTSNFQSSLRRLPSLRDEEEPSYRSRVYEAQRAAPRLERDGKTHKRGKSSKSSTSSAVSLEQMMAGTHVSTSQINPSKRRSASFDLGTSFQRYLANQNFDALDMSPYTSQRIHNLMDSAPEPVIPGGPRRHESPNHSPRVALPSHVESSLHGSNKSSRNTGGKKGGRTETLGTATIRRQEEEMKRLREASGQLGPVPVPNTPSQRSVTSSNKQIPLSSSSNEQIPVVRERPGFLRRVFGGSSRTSQPAPQTREVSGSALPNSQDSKNSLRQLDQSTSSTQKSIPEREPPVLTKKPSSFFRRRKKSVTDINPIPAVPNIGLVATDLNVLSSPASSLRQVMEPYLGDTISPVTTRHQLATSDTVVGLNEQMKSDQPGMQVKKMPSSNLQVPQRRFNQVDAGDDSFLADSSGNEETSLQGSPKQRSRAGTGRSNTTRDDTTEPATSPSKSAVETENPHRVSQLERAIPERSYTAPAAISTPPPKEGKPRSGSLVTTKKESKDWLESNSSEEQLDQSQISLPIEGAKESPQASTSDLSSSYKSTTSTQQQANQIPRSPRINLCEPTADAVTEEQNAAAMEKALEIYEDRDEDHEHVGAWLGDTEPERELVRRAFMTLFDWSGQNILVALRGLCARIALKGETQQVDRVLESFCNRWCECNPNNGFKSKDVVHTICYSLLLLNTDLHLADIDQRMTKAQFVRNTLNTVRNVVRDATGFETIRAGTWPKAEPSHEPTLPTIYSPIPPPENVEGRMSFDAGPSKTGATRPTDRLAREDSTEADAVGGPLVAAVWRGSSKAWEGQIDIVLKAFYLSISREKLPLYGAPVEAPEPTNSNNFLAITGNMLRRTPSTLSKAASEHVRGRNYDSRTTGRWTSKGRSRPKLYPLNTMGSARTSLDDQSSVWTPSFNSTWSRTSVAKTLTSMSVESFGSAFPGAEFQKSIGFASALSQAIIRDDYMSTAPQDEGMKEAPLLEDESLGLLGAPWAKEGLLQHKHHLDGIDKRSKDRNWSQCFAVIEKGWMRLFSFDANAKNTRSKARSMHRPGVPVGGGNWMDNAEEVWKFLLRQTIASALPPPGYSKSRPHVWALSLPTGAVHLFEVGTPEIVKEFVTTANYWSARMSKEPLVGGVSNIEYGWSDNAINRALINSESTSSVPAGTSRPSIQSSIRSSIDMATPSGYRARLPGDRLNIMDWTPPSQSLMPSALMEVDQLKALTSYVKNVEDELTRHNELRPAMLLAYSARHPNSTKAMNNWEKKSSYLLREIVKFRTYIDALKAAETRRDEVYATRLQEEEEKSKREEERDLEGTDITYEVGLNTPTIVETPVSG